MGLRAPDQNLVRTPQPSRQEEFVSTICSEADVVDVTSAILFTKQAVLGHPTAFDAFPIGSLYTKLRASVQHYTGELRSKWTEDLQVLIAEVKKSLIPWEEHGEEILEPGQKDLLGSLLRNPGYPTLTPLTAAIGAAVQAQGSHKILDSDLVAHAKEIAKEGAKLVSLTFSLFHIKVSWAKIKGHKNQIAEATKLRKIHDTSSFKESWSCLPNRVKDFITGFGATAA